jgi:hypothetical protein
MFKKRPNEIWQKFFGGGVGVGWPEVVLWASFYVGMNIDPRGESSLLCLYIILFLGLNIGP